MLRTSAIQVETAKTSTMGWQGAAAASISNTGGNNWLFNIELTKSCSSCYLPASASQAETTGPITLDWPKGAAAERVTHDGSIPGSNGAGLKAWASTVTGAMLSQRQSAACLAPVYALQEQ